MINLNKTARNLALCALAALAALGTATTARASDYEAEYLGLLWLTGSARGYDTNMIDSDNRRFELTSARDGRNQALEMGVLFQLPLDDIDPGEEFAAIHIDVEANIAPNGQMGVYAFNWDMGEWEQLSNARYTNRDKVISATIDDPAFIGPDGEVAIDFFRYSRNLRNAFKFKIDQVSVWLETF